MPFKFTLLGLEFSNCNSETPCEKKSRETTQMVKKKLTPQQKKFKTAQSKCHAETDSPNSFGKCMSEKLTNSKKKTKKGSKKK